METGPRCADCVVLRCARTVKEGGLPASCPTGRHPDLERDALEKARSPESQAVLQAWLAVMGRVKDPERPRERWAWTRIDEVMEYAKVRGMRRLGIASCYMLLPESKILSGILRGNGFEVVSVSCLCGETDPREIGLPGEVTCNPILQAEVLDREGTEMNIMMGLCVGHDILFLRHSRAETTPLVVKDRAMGHNPAAALYLAAGFYKERFKTGA